MNMPLQYLRSTQGVYISTTNSAISGRFDTNSSLNIRTTNGNLDVDVDLHDGGIHGVNKIEVQTTNG